jgi:glycosyltransferase involved in cell wall biosynthesis
VMKVIYWNNIPSPYFVERLNRIAQRGTLSVEAWFSQRTEPDRSWLVDETSWEFQYAYLGTVPLKAVINAVRLLRERRPDLLVCLYEKPEYVAVALAARLLGIPVVLHAMKTFDSQRPRRRRNEFAKRLLFSRVTGFHVPGLDAADYVKSYGARPRSIYSFPEPVDVASFTSSAIAADRLSLRQELGVEGCTYLYVGRLWRHKGVGYLLEAYARITRATPNVSLLVVGDGVDEAALRQQAKALPRVRFTGFVQKDELAPLYAAADVLVFPTLGDTYGHVIQEAMAAGLPVISTTAVAEVGDRVSDGVTGFLVPPGDAMALRDAMVRLARDEDLRKRLGRAGRSLISGRTLDWWASEFEEFAATVGAR